MKAPGVDSIEVGVQTGTKKDGTPAIQKVDMIFISEQNLYKVIMRSDKPQAEPFQDWVCDEVLPTIRKTGGYIAASTRMTDEEIMAAVLRIGEATIRKRRLDVSRHYPRKAFSPSFCIREQVNHLFVANGSHVFYIDLPFKDNFSNVDISRRQNRKHHQTIRPNRLCPDTSYNIR